METLVVVEQNQPRSNHYSQYFSSPSRSHAHDCFVAPNYPFSPPRVLKGVHCRSIAFSGTGILHSPSHVTMATKRTIVEAASPSFYSEPHKKQGKRSKPLSICIKSSSFSLKGDSFSDGSVGADLFAGPAYSNSPPPSSLPIPKFSLHQRRTISLELPNQQLEADLRPLAKSAPASPKLESAGSLSLDISVATENLRKILHLDAVED